MPTQQELIRARILLGKRMMAAGWVKQVGDMKDGEGFVWNLTPVGKEKVGAIMRLLSEMRYKTFSEADSHALAAVLHTWVLRSLEQQTPDHEGRNGES